MSQLADWKCHKIVKAGKILAFENYPVGHLTIEDINGAPCKIDMPSNAYARGRPVLGDYVVIYEDGYKSWSPAAVFEAGYARV